MRKYFLLLLLFTPFISSAVLPDVISTDQYTAEGFVMPSFNREWGPTDFINVFEYIIEKEKDSDYVLDKHKEPALFDKLTNSDNYSFLESPAIDYGTKVMLAPKLIGLLSKQVSFYMTKGLDSKKVIKYEAEMADLMIVLIKIVGSISNAADELARNTPNLTEVQLEGYQIMKNGIVSMVNGLLYTIEKEYSLYSERSICKLAEESSTFYKKYKERMPEDVITEYDNRILKMRKNHQLPCVKAAFAAIKLTVD